LAFLRKSRNIFSNPILTVLIVKVHVGFYGRARDIVGEDKAFVELDVKEGISVKELLNIVAERVSEKLVKRFLNKSIILTIVVNGVPINDLNYKLTNNSMVAFIPPSQGG